MSSLAQTLFDPYDVDRRLQQLGLSRAWFVEANHQGTLDLRNAPPRGFSGNGNYRAADMALSVLRSLPGGHLLSDDLWNIPVAVNGSGTLAIAVTTGDEFCGVVGEQDPSSRTIKGPATLRASERKRPFSWNTSGDDDLPIDFFVLLSQWSSPARFELSRPSVEASSGYITGWQERILLSPPEKLDLQPKQRVAPAGRPSLIRRKSA
jgi:hypothetical protein